mgnify:CR=1 FL=1
MNRDKNDNDSLLDTRLELELAEDNKEEQVSQICQETIKPEMKKDKANSTASEKELKVLGVGDWMLTILVFLIPIVNIIFMAVWAFSSKGNIHRRNLSRASLLWVIILLIAYVVAMSIAGFTIMDLFVSV